MFFFLYKNRARRNYISLYSFPKSLPEKISNTYPHLNQADVQLVLKALREYFSVCNIAKMKMVSMPSKVVDIAWHEFILFTREYEEFCHQEFGRFLHHTPTEAMKSKSIAKKGLKRAWYIACQRQNINSKSPTKIPLLFSIDTDLKISDGNNFVFVENISSFTDEKYEIVYSVEDIDCLGDGDGGGDGGGGGGGS